MFKRYAFALMIVLVIAGGLIVWTNRPPTDSHLRQVMSSERTAPEEINLVAVGAKVTPELLDSRNNFENAIFSWMDAADDKSSLGPDSLVVFPEDIGVLTVILGDGSIIEEYDLLTEAVESVVMSNIVSVGYHKLRHRVSWPRALFLANQRTMAEVYFETFSEAAREYESYVVAGTAALSDATLARYVPAHITGAPAEEDKDNFEDIYNVSVVFGPDGGVIGVQRKVHLIDLEGPEGLDFSAGEVEDLQVIPTSLGDLAVTICLDAFRDDVLQQLDDGDILVQPSANPMPWEDWQQEEWLFSSWRAVMEEEIFDYAVNPMLTGEVADMAFYGQSSIISSEHTESERGYSITGKMPGFLRVSETYEKEHIIYSQTPHPALIQD